MMKNYRRQGRSCEAKQRRRKKIAVRKKIAGRGGGPRTHGTRHEDARDAGVAGCGGGTAKRRWQAEQAWSGWPSGSSGSRGGKAKRWRQAGQAGQAWSGAAVPEAAAAGSSSSRGGGSRRRSARWMPNPETIVERQQAVFEDQVLDDDDF